MLSSSVIGIRGGRFAALELASEVDWKSLSNPAPAPCAAVVVEAALAT
jgi:hypothetical protein